MKSEEWECGDDCLALICVFVTMYMLPSRPTRQPYPTWPSVGKDSPGRKAEPLDLTSTPSEDRHARKLPLHKPTLSSLRAPATKDNRETPPYVYDERSPAVDVFPWSC
jgi:hypothetical protein